MCTKLWRLFQANSGTGRTRGTDGSNPGFSTEESANFRSLSGILEREGKISQLAIDLERRTCGRKQANAADRIQHAIAVGFAVLRRFRAKPDKKIVDGQAASPSSWKTPFIATCMVW